MTKLTVVGSLPHDQACNETPSRFQNKIDESKLSYFRLIERNQTMMKPRKMDMKKPAVMSLALSIAALFTSPALALHNNNQVSSTTQFLRRGLEQDDQVRKKGRRIPQLSDKYLMLFRTGTFRRPTTRK